MKVLPVVARIMRAFRLCKAFGWTTEQLGVPPQDKRLYLLGFEMILDRENW